MRTFELSVQLTFYYKFYKCVFPSRAEDKYFGRVQLCFRTFSLFNCNLVDQKELVPALVFFYTLLKKMLYDSGMCVVFISEISCTIVQNN